MTDAAGRLITLVAYDSDGLPRPVLVDADGNLQCVNMAAAGGGALKTPSGKLFTPVANDPDDLPRPFLVDADGYIKVAVSNLPAGGSMTLIEDIKLTAAAASFDFTNIPATYAYLRLFIKARNANAATYKYALVRFNNDPSVIYDWTAASFYEPNTLLAATSRDQTRGRVLGSPGAGAAAGRFGIADLLIFGYAEIDVFTQWVSNCWTQFADLDTTTYTQHLGGHWTSQAIINRITLTVDGGSNWVSGSRVSLYGINA